MIGARSGDERMHLSILNFFSPPGEAVALAALCDRAGAFHRFWVGEHHTRDQVADPLALALLTAATTKRIRVGTGAVSLTFRNPYLVAEAAILAEFFFPGRVDLGVTSARAGASKEVVDMLMDGADRDAVLGGYERRLTLLRDVLARERGTKDLSLGSVVSSGPPMFVMGTSEERARRAGELGVGFVASFHHGGTAGTILAMMRAYRQCFRPSPLLEKPHGIVVVSGYVSDDPARREAAIASAKRARAVAGVFDHTVSVYGDPAHAALELRRLAAEAEADEVMFLCDVEQECEPCYLALAKGWMPPARKHGGETARRRASRPPHGK